MEQIGILEIQLRAVLLNERVLLLVEQMGATHTTHVANAHKEPVWVKIDGNRDSHKFQPTNSDAFVNTTGGTFYSFMMIFSRTLKIR